MAKASKRRRISWEHRTNALSDTTWHEIPKNWNQLVGLGRALQGKNPWNVRKKLDMEVAGRTFLEHQYIEIDPCWFGNIPADAQYEMTKSVIMHEAGHRRFTDPKAWPGNASALKHNMINLLEDYRIETGMKEMYPRRAEELEKMVYALVNTPNTPSPPEHDYAVVALHIFQERMGSLYLPFNILDYAMHVERWLDIAPLVREASRAPNTARVNEIADEILELLGLDDDDVDTDEIEEQFPSCCDGSSAESTGGEGSLDMDDLDTIEDLFTGDGELAIEPREIESLDKPIPQTVMDVLGAIASEISPEHSTGWDDNELQKVPYHDLLRLAHPAIRDMEIALSIPRKTLVKEPSPSGGRVSVRDWIKNPDQPFRNITEEVSKPTVALSVMIDCSTSMLYPRSYPTCERVSSLAMAIYIAAMQTKTPCRFTTLPGKNRPDGRREARVICYDDTPQQLALPLLASISKPWGNYEDVPFLLPIEGTWLASQDAEVKLIFVLHDGQSNDSHLIKEEIRKLRGKNIRVLGIGLNIRDALLKEQFGERNFVTMENIGQIGKIMAKRIKNLRRL